MEHSISFDMKSSIESKRESSRCMNRYDDRRERGIDVRVRSVNSE